ncbi:hypothetical protein OAX78_03290 [Planctomycetota bacterium]|nr:hypothetical protein [Planctomycetota bacterium]
MSTDEPSSDWRTWPAIAAPLAIAVLTGAAWLVAHSRLASSLGLGGWSGAGSWPLVVLIVGAAALAADARSRTLAQWADRWRKRLARDPSPAPPRVSRRKKVLFACGLQIGALLFGLGVVELSVDRRLVLPNGFEWCPAHAVIVNRPQQSATVRARLTPGRSEQASTTYLASTDSWGCRSGNAPPPARPSHTLAFVGDSFCWGSHAAYEETYVGRIAAALPATRVHDFGVQGASSFSYPDMLSCYVERTGADPDVLVVTFTVDMHNGDLPRVVARRKHGPFKTFAGYWVSPSRHAQLERSGLARAMFHTQAFMRTHSSVYNLVAPHGGSPEFATPLQEDLSADAFPVLLAYLTQALDALRAVAGVEPGNLVVMLNPSRAQTSYATSRGPQSASDPQAELAREFWTAACAEFRARGHVVSDARVPFERALGVGEAPFTADGHMSSLGFRLAADQLKTDMDAAQLDLR